MYNIFWFDKKTNEYKFCGADSSLDAIMVFIDAMKCDDEVDFEIIGW